MNISAHDYSNQTFTWNGPAGNGGWGPGWNSQQLVTAAIVTATGGTYETEAPVKEDVTSETPVKRGPGRPKKTQ